jgi:hypothetical protein
VLFFHVPSDASSQAVETATELAINLIRAMVESDLQKKRQDKDSRGARLP